MVIQGIFPFCFTPELYAAKPEYIDQLAAFVQRPARTRRLAMTLSASSERSSCRHKGHSAATTP
jgi:hypothetical protein